MNFEQLLSTGTLAEIRRFLHKDPIRIRGRQANGTPWSYLAVRRGDIDLVRWVVEYSRADMNELDAEGRNILFPAIESDSVEICRYFVERVGISPLEADRHLTTPLEYAAKLGKSEVLAYLEDQVGFTLAESYKNPVRSGFSPDPSVVRVGDDYYMVNSSFVSFPAIPISHSTDLVNWTTIGHAVTNSDWIDFSTFDSGRGFWAPDISYHEGRFYIIVTLRYNDTEDVIRRQMVVSSERPEGPYSEPTFLEEDGIDPSLFADGDRRYVLLNRGVRIFEVDSEAKERLSETTLLYYGDSRKATEAPHLIKRGDYYYLFMAEGGTGQGHEINVARASSLHGLYLPCPFNPILAQKDSVKTIQRTGHGKPVETQNGEWYIFYLASRQYEPVFSSLGRETFLDRLDWTADGWPIINGNRTPSAISAFPALARNEVADNPGFGHDSLGYDWYFIRNPLRDSYRVSENMLSIRSSNLWPDEPFCKQILVRRQSAPDYVASVEAEVEGLAENTTTGLISYYDEFSWHYLCLQKQKGQLHPYLYVQNGLDKEMVSGEPFTSAEPLCFRVEVNWPNYSYTISEGDKIRFSVDLESRILTDEGCAFGKRFTGPGIGVFSHDPRGEQTVVFRNFTFEELER